MIELKKQRDSLQKQVEIKNTNLHQKRTQAADLLQQIKSKEAILHAKSAEAHTRAQR